MISSLILMMTGVFAAAVLRGITGFLFGLAAVPLLSLALLPAEVVPSGGHAAGDHRRGRIARGERACATGALLSAGLLCGMPIGLVVLTANAVRLAIGGVFGFAVWLVWRGVRLPPEPSRMVSFGPVWFQRGWPGP